jgi:hypothetical protein
MERSAHVTSIESIRSLRAALFHFESDARDAVTLLVLEVRKAVDWLENDRARYWPDQYRKASDAVVQARSDLERCQMRFGSEDAPSCYEQKKALERAKRRLRLCEEKVRTVKRWVRNVRTELNEFEGRMARMNDCLDTDVPRAAATLDRMLRALERYAETPTPADAPPSGAGARADDATEEPPAGETTP